MIRITIAAVGTLGFFLMTAAQPANAGILPDEVKCEYKKVHTGGKLAKSLIKVCHRKEAQTGETTGACISDAQAKMDKQMVKIESVYDACPTAVDSPTLQGLIALYSQQIVDTGTSNYDELPCTPLCSDRWTFEAGASDKIRAIVDTTDPDMGADLALTLDCPSDAPVLGDNEMPCTYSPTDGTGCPEVAHTSSASQTCSAYVEVVGGCVDSTVPYRVRITTGGSPPVSLQRAANDVCP